MGAGQAWQSHCEQAVPGRLGELRLTCVLCLVCRVCVYVSHRCAWSPPKAGQIQSQLLGALLLMIWRTLITSDSSRRQKKAVHPTHHGSTLCRPGRNRMQLVEVQSACLVCLTPVCAWAHTCSARVWSTCELWCALLGPVQQPHVEETQQGRGMQFESVWPSCLLGTESGGVHAVLLSAPQAAAGRQHVCCWLLQ